MDLYALKSELELDPAGMGYGDHPGDNNTVALLINAVPAPATDGPYTIDVARLPSEDVRGAIPHSELPTPGSALADGLRFYTHANTTPNTPEVRAFFAAAFSGATLAALNALTTRGGSRAEFLWGADTTVSATEVAAALALP